MRTSPVALTGLVVLVSSVAWADAALRGAISRVYLEKRGDIVGYVHVVDRRDHVVSSRNAYGPTVAPDGATVGWLSCIEYTRSAKVTEYLGAALVLYRNGRRIRVIAGEPLVRDWRFWDGGRAVAVAVGAHHGPGWYRLIDVETGKELGRTSDRELYLDGKLIVAPPAWAEALAR